MMKPTTGDRGFLLLYGDRLEWKGDTIFVIQFDQISLVEKKGKYLIIKMVNNVILELQPFAEGEGFFSGFKGLVKGSFDKEVDSWYSAIMSTSMHF